MTKKVKNYCKQSLICGLMIVIGMSIASCKQNNEQNPINDAIAICYEQNTPYLVNAKNERFSLAYYDEIIEIFNDYIGVKKDNKYGFIDRTGKEVIAPSYDKVYPMYEEKAVVIKDGKYYIINNEGEIIYSFSNGITSESYFSNNHLIVTKGGKYGYLFYENDEFKLTNINFDYASVYNDEYAVVGKKETIVIYEIDKDGNLTDNIAEIKELETIKYNFLNSQNQLLFSKFEFDFADTFYDGWARVGYKTTMYAPILGSSNSKAFKGIEYHYINELGEALYLNHYYEYSYNGVATSMHDTSEVVVPYATNFNDGYAVIANYRYSSTVDTFYKEYRIVNTKGKLQYTEAIYYATGYRYGYEQHSEFQAKSPSLYWINKIVKIGDVLAFKTGNTANSPSFNIRYFEIQDKINNQAKYDLYNISWDLYEQEFNETTGDYEKVIPNYMIDYNEKYLNGVSSTIMVESSIKSPFEMDELTYSKYISSDYPINRIRILRSNYYGLVKYEAKEKYLSTINQNITDIVASFIIEPIYDKIIY